MELVKDSGNIRVFPASLRTYNGMGKYTTENNLTGIPRSVHDYSSYILSRTKESTTEKPFRFMIHGYYFELDDMGFDSTGESLADANYYLEIRVENTHEYSRLVDTEDGGTDLDISEIFNGLRAIQSDEELDPEKVEGDYTLYRLRLTDDKGNLYPGSFIRDLPDSIGDRDGQSVGCFEVATDGRLGFSKPIYLKSIGGFKVTNAIFWGETAPTPTCVIPETIEHKTAELSADVGDIFFKL